MLSEIPLEIWVNISIYLDKTDIYYLSLTNKSMYMMMTSDSVWWPKIKKSWYMSDYNAQTLTYKKKLKHNESYYQYFKRKKLDDQFVRSCIDDIINYNLNNNDNSIIIEKLNLIYNNFDSYIPCLLSESLHLTSSLFNSDGFITSEIFSKFQKRRNLKLDRIYIASNILESGKFLKCLKNANNYFQNLPTDLESVLVELSLLDPRYHELILIRHSVIKTIIFNYKSINFEPTTKPIEKIMLLVRIMHHVIDSKKKKILLMNQFSTSKLTIEDLSILRFYSGDSEGTPLIKNAIVEKLCIMLNLNQYIEINDCCIKILDNNQFMYLFIDGNQMYLKKESDVHEILRKFPMEDASYILLRSRLLKINNEYNKINFENKKKLMYICKFINYYDNLVGSRLDDLRGADQIIYQMKENEKIVVVHRYNYIQGQILCCGGFFNKYLWNSFKSLLLNGKLNDLSFLSIFTLPIVLKFENNQSSDLNSNFNKLFLKNISYEINDNDLFKLQETMDIFYECENLSIGDIIWSESSQARGVIIEISDSQSKIDSKKINLFNGFTFKKKNIRFNGTPLYTIFFGAYGFATFTKQYIKRDKTDRIEGLLVYDLLGRWFSHYDYELHKFIFRYGQLLLGN